MSNTAQILVIGLPGSGKTTFLAALWHVLAARGNATSLMLNQTSEDRTYLNQISQDWRQCLQVPRTNLQAEQAVTLHLHGAGLGMFDLVVPDLSGEAFEHQLTDRRISVAHDEFVRNAAGVLLFVHPDVQTGIQLTHALQLEAAIGGVPDRGASTGGPAAQWTVENLPTQVKLVELLQFILERAQRRVRVSILISAWDLVDSFGPPHEFLSRVLPLLRQFLDANDDVLEHAVFGVSAQGGDVTVPEEKQDLLRLDDPTRRIKVRQGNNTDNDITKPIAWLLGGK